MALGPVALAFVGASGRDHLKRIIELKGTHGSDWPAQWLAERGIAEARELLGAGEAQSHREESR